MTPTEQNHNDDLLDQALQALRETPIPPEPPADTLKAVLAAAPAGTTWAHRLKNVKRLTKIAAAFILAAGIISLIIIAGHQDQTSPDFNRIVQPLLAARTATFKVTIDTQGLPLETQEGMFMDPALLRQTRPDTVQIMDLTLGRMLTLTPKQKTAIMVELQNPPPNQFNFLDIKEFLLQAQLDEQAAVEYLGKKLIAGQTARGYLIKQPLLEMTLWAGADNLRPIRLESTMDIEGKRRHVAIHDFAFDVDLDKSLFSLKAPDYYTVFVPASPLSNPFNIGAVKEFFDPLKKPLKELTDSQQLPPVMALMAVRRIIIL